VDPAQVLQGARLLDDSCRLTASDDMRSRIILGKKVRGASLRKLRLSSAVRVFMAPVAFPRNLLAYANAVGFSSGYDVSSPIRLSIIVSPLF